MQSTTATSAPAQAVRIFSPVDQLPGELATMDCDTVWAHIRAARRLIQHHQDVADNGDESASRYYFFIPEVAEDMANARYTLNVCFAELKRRETAASVQTLHA